MASVRRVVIFIAAFLTFVVSNPKKSNANRLQLGGLEDQGFGLGGHRYENSMYRHGEYETRKQSEFKRHAIEQLIKRWFGGCGIYNPLSKGCCHGNLYLAATHACCGNKVVKKLPCGEELYSPCKEGCCRGKMPRVYTTAHRKCCNGKVELALFSKKCVSIFG